MASKKKPEFNLNFVSEIFAEYLSVDEKSVLALHIEYLLLGVTHELLQIFQTEISSIRGCNPKCVNTLLDVRSNLLLKFDYKTI